MPSRFSHDIPHDNEILIKQDGNLWKQHYTHTYIYDIYVHLQSCTYISDVSKRGVLGSADDDIACFLHILSILVVIYFFCWSWACFFGEYLHILHIYNTILHLFCILWQIVYCSWKDLFAIYMHILHICSTICMEDTERSKNASNILEF